MKKFSLLIFLIIISLSFESYANTIISAISSNQINIDTKFSGAEILLFGAKEERGEIVILVRGPQRNYLISKKERFLGVWHNNTRLAFKNIYDYYSLSSTSSQSEYNKELLETLEIGEKNLKFKSKNSQNQIIEEEFRFQLINKFKRDHLYINNKKDIEFLNDSLFKAVLKFPKNISRGVYMVEIYLINGENLTAFQAIPIFINQVGLTADIHDFAYNNPFLYALSAIFIAIFAGFIANYIFARFIGK
jgi:uncharacterized protein (TIGR02186 family)